MKKINTQLLLSSAILAGLLCSSQAATLTLPTASVTGAAVDKTTVCPAAPTLTVSATAGASYDTDASATTYGNFTAGGGTFNSQSYTRTRIKTVTTYAYTDKHVTVTADGVSSQTFALADGAPPYAFAALVALSAGDGSKKSVISAIATETKTATPTSSTEYWTGNGQSANGTLRGTSAGTPGAPVVTSVASSSTTLDSPSYLVDLEAPNFEFANTPNGIVTEGHSIPFSIKIKQGSASQPFKVTTELMDITADAVVATTQNEGTLPANASGIARDEQVTLALRVPCGLDFSHSFGLRATVESTGICGAAWPPQAKTSYDPATGAGGFSVTPAGVLPHCQMFILSELSGGDYGLTQAFDAVKPNDKLRKVNTTPGAVHLAQLDGVVSAAGDNCAVSASESYHPTQATLTAPAGFSFELTGQTFTHLFVGEPTPNSSLDLHYPTAQGLLEVPTGSMESAPALNGDGSTTITLDLSWLPLDTPATAKIYIRAKFRYSGPTVPADGTVYTFRAANALDQINQSTPPDGVPTAATATMTLTRQVGYVLP